MDDNYQQVTMEVRKVPMKIRLASFMGTASTPFGYFVTGGVG